MRESREALEAQIEARLADRFPEVELVDLEVRGGRLGTLTLFIDRPGGVDLELCAAVSQALDDVREQYSLEVSSPGLDRRLRKPAHFAARARREVAVKLDGAADGRSNFRGELVASRRGARSRSGSPRAGDGHPAALPTSPGPTWSTTLTPTEANVSREIIEALRQIEKEKGIAFEALVDALEDALLSAYKKTADAVEHAKVEIDTETGDMRVFQLIFPEHIDVEALKVHDEEGQEIGLDLSGVDMSEVERIEVTPENFGRIAAQTAKQVILQRIREAERDLMYDEYIDRVGELVTGIVQQSDPRHNTLVELGRVEAELPRGEQIETEHYEHGARIKAVIMRVEESAKGPQVKLSRKSEELVRKLFELEVPEIADGLVEIK